MRARATVVTSLGLLLAAGGVWYLGEDRTDVAPGAALGEEPTRSSARTARVAGGPRIGTHAVTAAHTPNSAEEGARDPEALEQWMARTEARLDARASSMEGRLDKLERALPDDLPQEMYDRFARAQERADEPRIEVVAPPGIRSEAGALAQ